MSWITELVGKFVSNVSSVFIVHGNTLDYCPVIRDGQTLYFQDCMQLLEGTMQDRSICIRYDLLTGWNFTKAGSEEKVRAALRPPDPPPLPGRVTGYASPSRYEQAAQAAGIQEPMPKLPSQALPMMTRLFQQPDPDIALLIDFPESIFAAERWKGDEQDARAVTLLQWARLPTLRTGNSIVVLVCRDRLDVLHPSLLNPESKIEVMRIPYPDHEARKLFLTYLQAGENETELGFTYDPQQIATMTAGLSLRSIEEAILRCRQEKQFSVGRIKERKAEVIKARYQDVIQLAEPEHGWEAIGGLTEIKEFMIHDIAKPMREGNRARVPMGALLMGPPGTGKSVVAEAVAKEAGVLFVTLLFSKIFSKWVGESERNLDRVLDAVSSFAPCIVFIDEIDQAGHRRGESAGDSGVSSRIFQRLLEFMSETNHRGRICFLAATNRPDLMDPAMKRAGRFDVKIPFLPPNAEARREIIKAICAKNGFTLKGRIEDSVILHTDGWVGADIEMLVIKARNLTEDTKGERDTVRGSALNEVLEHIVPSLQPLDIAQMMLFALRECNDRRLLPEAYRPKKKHVPTLEESLAKMGFNEEEIKELMAEKDKEKKA